MNILKYKATWKGYWILGTRAIHGRVSIDTLDRYPWSISNQYLIDIWVDTLSTLDQQSGYCRLSVNRLIWIDQKLVGCRPALDEMSIECPPRCWWSVVWVSIEGPIEARSIDGQSIDSRSRMPLVVLKVWDKQKYVGRTRLLSARSSYDRWHFSITTDIESSINFSKIISLKSNRLSYAYWRCLASPYGHATAWRNTCHCFPTWSAKTKKARDLYFIPRLVLLLITKHCLANLFLLRNI